MSTSTAKKTPAKPTAKRAPAKKVQPKAAKAQPVSEDAKDYTYLAEKDPTALHEDMAAWLVEVSGYEPDDMEQFIKAVQLTAVLRGVYQRSDRNKSRAEYRALPAEIVAQRSAHMLAAHAEAQVQIEARKAAAKPAKKAAPAPAKRTASRTTAPAAKKATAPRKRTATKQA